MARYTDNKGNLVEVSEQHVQTAIDLKIELQKISPSGKVSWAQHKKMMKLEGFEDSGSNESYRCMIKGQQKKLGLLPSVEKYADMLSDNKLQSIKNEIGEMSLAKRDAQNSFRVLNKLKREMSDNILFYEEIAKGVSKIKFDDSLKGMKRKDDTENSILVNMTDWHIGLSSDTYNYEIAKEKVKSYAREIIHYATVFKVNTVNVWGIGDLVNGSYMRPTQVAENEFTYSEQIIKATEIIFSFLNMLSKELNVVYLGSVQGNHSRMNGRKGENLDFDSAENVIDATIKLLINASSNKRISVDDAKETHGAMSYEINGRKIKAVHGDLISKKSNEKLQKFISADEVIYDLLVYGHFHHSSIIEENNDRLSIGAGCLQGTTDYSKQLGYETIPSQTIIVFEGSRILPIRIVLE